MTDFAKEARDLWQRLETHERAEDEIQTIAGALRKQRAAGLAEARARAAEIARAPVQIALMVLCAIERTYDLHPNMRKDANAAIGGLRAILSGGSATNSGEAR